LAERRVGKKNMLVRKLTTIQERLRILGNDEIEALYGRPRFTHEERMEFVTR
jgi:hypothetical protein